jgi:gentisate 1,2-dioxygenase
MVMKMRKDYLVKNLDPEQIRQHGGIGNLNEGIEILLHDIPTRLIAWPGNGYQTESVHVLTVSPGMESGTYNYPISEEALLCVEGRCEIFLHNKWLELQPGDIAYFPENVPHAIRAKETNAGDTYLVSSITPPLISLYKEAGFYIEKLGRFDYEACETAKLQSQRGNLSPKCFLRYHQTHPQSRAWNMKSVDIRKKGALFNMFRGAEFDANGSPMRFVLWPGHGVRQCGFHLTRCGTGDEFAAHVHPVSDECVIVWAGQARGHLDGLWLEMGIHDCLMAPCGVQHGGPLNIDMNTSTEHEKPGDTLWGGFASPPQGDLYLRSGYVQNGQVKDPKSVRFKNITPLGE